MKIYFADIYEGLQVFCSPNLTKGEISKPHAIREGKNVFDSFDAKNIGMYGVALLQRLENEYFIIFLTNSQGKLNCINEWLWRVSHFVK